ncbi:uncharacterized protein RCO7_14341 [Rhynchosporium graminicola]|uniref:Uncharacterized protein n=1 Tax=Rhynchosporium graminicola TaxID=2792576 RepID=A0A1E1KA52_9HELO|nr:uncharacterized protein RCO7_14341 [Rhynchosporium commune]
MPHKAAKEVEYPGTGTLCFPPNKKESNADKDYKPSSDPKDSRFFIGSYGASKQESPHFTRYSSEPVHRSYGQASSPYDKAALWQDSYSGNETGFECPVCQARSKHAGSFKIHLDKMHGMRNFFS